MPCSVTIEYKIEYSIMGDSHMELESEDMTDVSTTNKSGLKRKSCNEVSHNSPKRRKDSDALEDETPSCSLLGKNDNGSHSVTTKDKEGSCTPPLSDSQETIGFDLEVEIAEDEPGCSKDLPQESPKKPAISKIASVQRDSEMISNILDVGTDKIYRRLLDRRAAPNRVELVTNDLLEDATGVSDSSNGGGKDQVGSDGELIADVEWICSQLQEKDSDAKIDPNEVYLLLERNINKSERREVVLRQLNQKARKEEVAVDEPDIMKDVATVTAVYPKADANAVYGLLESQKNQSKRVECVMHILRGKYGEGDGAPVMPSANKSDEDQSKALSKRVVDASSDPLHGDVLILSQIFPNKDHDELYAYLQAHRTHPNRLQIVNRELLRIDEFEESPSFDLSDSFPRRQESFQSFENSSLGFSSGPNGIPSRRIDRELELLSAVYPLCDPNYLFERLEVHQKEKDRVQVVSQELENDATYPRRKDTEEKQKRQNKLKGMTDLDANLQDLIAAFPDISDHFYSSEKDMSENYKKHLKAQLKYDFPWLKSSFLGRVTKAHNNHLLPTYRQLESLRPSDVRSNCRKLGRQVVNERTRPEYPDDLDDYFFKELLFARNEHKIMSKLNREKEERNRRFDEAKSLGLLQECVCCYDDEVLLEDVLECPEGHMFCKSCVQRSTEVIVGEARAKFPCLTADCKSAFTLQIIQQAVSQKTYSLVLRRIQEEELREAGIENLVTCPFCTFATIMENPDDKVFKCLNPECMKESCRLCQEESHIPLRCDEVEKKHEIDMRTYIENKMSESMVRTCYKCNKRFYKIEGCNFMTCVCGATMCYVCRIPLDGTYEHLNEDGRCNNSNAEEIHQNEVSAAFREARQSYLRDHPEAADIELKHNPQQYLRPGSGDPAGVRKWSAMTDNDPYDEEEEAEESSDDDLYY